jgi:hypothetical protein
MIGSGLLMARVYFRILAVFYLVFGIITTFAPRLLQLFMTPQGMSAVTPFSDQVWLHDGLDILSVALLLAVLSLLPASKTTLGAAAVVALLPVAAIGYSLATSPYWTALFLVPGVAALALAGWGFFLARGAPMRDEGASARL